MSITCRRTAVLTSVAFVALVPPARAAYLGVHGGPVYATAEEIAGRDRDFKVADATLDNLHVGNGVAAVTLTIRNLQSVPIDRHVAMRWDASGAEPVVLGSFGGDAFVHGLNDQGTAVGRTSSADRTGPWSAMAVRWDADSTVPAILPGMDGIWSSAAGAINDQGDIAGIIIRSSGQEAHAVRWSADGQNVTVLGRLAPEDGSWAYTNVRAINDSAAIIGVNQFNGESGEQRGYRAVRWDPQAPAPLQLEVLSTFQGEALTEARAINNSNITVGYTRYYLDDWEGKAVTQPVRWDAQGRGMILPTSTESSQRLGGIATAVNDAGSVVGKIYTRSIAGKPLGERAVLWSPDGTSLAELDVSETGYAGRTMSDALDINASGVVVGHAMRYVPNTTTELGYTAVLWHPDAGLIDLNAWIDPSSGWVLRSARQITDTGWVVGWGLYDPDGQGSMASEARFWLMDVSSIPEPRGACVWLAAWLGLRRQRPNPAAIETDVGPERSWPGRHRIKRDGSSG